MLAYIAVIVVHNCIDNYTLVHNIQLSFIVIEKQLTDSVM